MKLEPKEYFLVMFEYTDSQGTIWTPACAFRHSDLDKTKPPNRFDIKDNSDPEIRFSYLESETGCAFYSGPHWISDNFAVGGANIKKELLKALQEFFSPWGKTFYYE